MRFGLIAWVLLFLASWACAGQADRTIQVGDRLQVTCAEESKLDGEYTVNEDGLVLMEFLGGVRVQGLTSVSSAQLISRRLVEDRILRKATVTVKFLAGKPVEPEPEPDPEPEPAARVKWSGAIDSAGEGAHVEGMKLSDVLMRAGLRETTDLARITITRADGTTLAVDATDWSTRTDFANPVLLPGDEVAFVEKELVGDVEVVGVVGSPGKIAWKRGMTISQAIDLSGGALVDADLARVQLQRAGQVTAIDLAGGLGDLQLEIGDVVTVPLKQPTEFVDVLGAVVFPGRVGYRQGLTLGEAVRRAGGILPDATLNLVKWTKRGETKPATIDLSLILQGMTGDPPLSPGDRIEIPGLRKRPRDYRPWAAGAALLFFLRR